jgi:hypothetical protein
MTKLRNILQDGPSMGWGETGNLELVENQIKVLMLEVFVDALHDANTFGELADKFHEGVEKL